MIMIIKFTELIDSDYHYLYINSTFILPMNKKTFIFLTLIFASTNSYSENIAKTDNQLNRIMVIGNPENINKISGSAQYIGPEQLDNNNYNDINRVLRAVPGINIQEEEGYGNRPNIGIRGGRSERSADITLMEDGILIAPAPYAASSAYYFPRVQRMKAIEIRKGSSAIKFGPRTTNGAVNLVSKSIPNKEKSQALFLLGADNTQRLQYSHGNKVRKYSALIDVGHEKTNGFKKIDIVGGNTGFSIQDFMGKFRISSDSNADTYQYLEFKIGNTEEDSNETYLGLTQDDFESDPYIRYAASQKDNITASHKQYQISHYYEPSENLDITTSLYRNNFARNWYKLQSVIIGGTKESLDDALDDSSYLSVLKGETDLAGDSNNNLTVRANNRSYISKGIQTNIAYQINQNKLQHQIEAGIRYHLDEEDRYQHEDLYSITSGVMNAQSYGAAGSNANRLAEAEALAIFIEDQIQINKLTISPGLRNEDIKLKRTDRDSGNSYENNLNVLLPAIGFNYEYDKNLNLFAGIYEGFAPPSPSTNTSQKEESSVNYEAGFRYKTEDIFSEVTLFFNDYSNLLGQATLSSGSTGDDDQYNGGDVNVLGVEAAIQFDLAKYLNADISASYKLPFSFNYTYTNAEFQSSFDSNFDEWGSVTAGDELPYIPNHQFYCSLGIETSKWSVNSSAKFVDKMRTVAGSGSIAYGSGTDSHLIIDLSYEYNQNEKSRFFASINNLFDKEYVAARRPYGARPGSPLTILAGMKIDF